VLDEVLDVLICPHCGAALVRQGGAVRCAAGHSFDVARQGYLSLLPGDAELGSADTAEMVAARERFLDAGHFDPLADALAGEAERALGRGADGCVLELGAGTGWLLSRVLEAAPGRAGLALDLSKHALRRAARAHERIGAVAADAWRPLPVRDGGVALAMSVFAPRNGAEIARVLSRAGALIVATPTGRHLIELVETLGLLTVDERKSERLAAKLDPHLSPPGTSALEWTLALSREEAFDVVAMGPSAVHVQTAVLREAIEGLSEPVSVTASVKLSVRRPL
jgi:23S rRNA (guanine745-N1)-methyltransferase